MNETLVLQLAQSIAKDKKITYEDFDNAFNMLSMREQYKVSELIYENGFELIDSDDEFQNMDKELCDETLMNIFTSSDVIDDKEEHTKNKELKDSKIEYVKTRKNVKLNNRALIELIQNGSEQAAQDLCVKNSGLVYKIVHKCDKRLKNTLDINDLEQAGMIGLLTAARKFDLSMETQFSTYAVYWIKQSIIRTIFDTGYLIRIPVHEMEKIVKFRKVEQKFSYINDIRIIDAKIKEELNFTDEEIMAIRRIYELYLSPSSCDMPLNEDGETTLLEVLPIEDEVLVEEEVDQIFLKENLLKVVETLTPKEQEIIKLRFGYYNNKTYTLEEVGKKFNLTRERIRQIESKALRKLRHPTRLKKIIDFK